MQNRRKRNIVIGVLCSLLVFMGIGYAILSQVLMITGSGTISGNWDIYIDSITVDNINGTAVSTKSEVGSNKLSAQFDATLGQPTDYIEYKVVVKNAGTINAELSSAVLVPEKSHEYVIYTTTAEEGTLLNAGSQMEFIVKVAFKDITSYTREEETIRTVVKLQLNFIQKVTTPPTPNAGGGTVTANADSCFTITSSGEILRYDYTCGTSVVIPDTISGTQVTSIGGSFAFTDFNYVSFSRSDGIPEGYTSNKYVIVFDHDNFATIRDKAIEDICGSTPNCLSTDYVIDASTLSTEDLANYYSAFSGVSTTYKYDTQSQTISSAYSSITSLDLSLASHLINIGDRAFYDVSGTSDNRVYGHHLTSLNFGSITSLTTVGAKAFAGNGLTTLTLPTGLTTIGNASFAGSTLTAVTIPSTVTSIDELAFMSNENLTSITVNRSATGMTLGEDWCGISDCTATGGKVTYSE